MRTTVVLMDHLVARARELSKAKTLSGLLNGCLADWIGRQGPGLFLHDLGETGAVRPGQ